MLLAFSALAQSESVAVLKDVVVTATRSETLANAVISDVTVVTRDDIEKGSGRSVSELLARMAGVQMASNGGLGKNSSIFIRGTETRHVLLLVDGVRYGSATSGTPNFDTIPLEMIERIEVLKGPASALYGSDAVGGVIQIFTRKGGTGFHPYASVTAGEADRAELSTGFTGGEEQFSYSLGVQTLEENGFSSTNRRIGGTATTGFNADRDGFSQKAVNASMGWKLTKDWKIDATGLQTEGVNHYDGGTNPFDVRTEFVTSVKKLGLQGQLTSAWKSRVEGAVSTDKATSLTSTSTSQFDTEQEQWSWQNEVATPLGLVFAGLDSLREKVSGTQAYAVSNRTTDSAFVGVSGDAGAHSWQANTRQDRNSQFGNANTGLLAYGYRVTPDLRLRGSYGTSFKVPSFNSLYWVSSGFNGNPTTQPETGENAELGATLALGDQLLSLTHYQNRIKGFITTQPAVSNIPYVRIDGWTLALEGAVGAWDYRTSLDMLDARNEANGLKLIRRPDAQVTASASYAVGEWRLGASWLVASEAFDDAANTKPLGGYGTVDVHARKAVGKDWFVEGNVVNLGDKFYQTALGYNQPGRSAYITLRYQPK
ncbi:TonB-dependent receptor domain-containing protein [Rhodoferax saidenbachensis]|uniref:TonB-dependent receptor domain-containing protein n=1 Tax=Rhodoferax saidenbachensis TaxID=1484693 RepID=UPI001FD3C7B7|nr:TonB-dependent receptor [Rhodoferax saidenbachensis]